MKIVIFGLTITSSWGNGHATTFRALCSALSRRGHTITFIEKQTEWYLNNRDQVPEYCTVVFYDQWRDVIPRARQELAGCDLAIAGSYFPDGIAAVDLMLDSAAPVKAFYDIDTPVTLAGIKAGRTEYLERRQLAGIDLYLSFTGGNALHEFESMGARKAVALYCSFDPDVYRPTPVNPRFQCDLSFMGTYAADRQPKLQELLVEPAQASGVPMIVAGPQYPGSLTWPPNVERIMHLEPKYHPEFYSSSRFTLNVTRREMVKAGYSPSVRLFEAAACGACILSDNWPGLETFFTPGRELLLVQDRKDVLYYLGGLTEQERWAIGAAARERVMAKHSNSIRAAELESFVGSVGARSAGAIG